MDESQITGSQRYEAFWAKQFQNPEFARLYAEEAEKKSLWLALVEARQAAGLTQAQVAERLGLTTRKVARMEQHGYESCSVDTLRRCVRALGEGYEVCITIHLPASAPASA